MVGVDTRVGMRVMTLLPNVIIVIHDIQEGRKK
jgi:hypothetical protein